MAQIKRIVRENPLSSFQQGTPSGGGAFRLLAEGLQEVYDRVTPVAEDQLKRTGEIAGRESAREQFGDARPFRQPEPSLSGGGGTSHAAGGAYRDAIASIESRGSGDYRAIGPTNKKLGRALGRYQIMEANIGPWSKEALGREVSADEFLASDAIQDKIFDHKFGGYVSRFGEAGAAQAWFAGPGGVGKTGRKDVLGTSVGVYGRKFMDALAGAGGNTSLPGGLSVEPGAKEDDLSSPTSTPSAPYEPPTVVRTSSGALESRLYSPYSGPLLQVHNAAARVAYQAEVLNKSAVDLMDMSAQFPMDPDGYQDAAEQYVETMVDSAPTDYQGELRGTLMKEVQRRAFGMMEDKQRDTRNRANNSSAALVERYSDNLTDAIASGDANEIAAAQSQLDDVLQVREALPGLAWTTEQSANVIIDARNRAARLAVTRQKEADKEVTDKLNLIIKLAKDGAIVEGEDILNDPAVREAYPELAREAEATVTLRDNMPKFLELTPAQQAAAAAALAAEEVVEEWQFDIAKAAGDIAKASKKAWNEDPVKRAGEVMKTDPPPPMPELTLDDPSKIVEGLAERRAYMKRIHEQGYTETRSFLSDQEAKEIQAVMGSDTPPELRAAISGAIVAGFGPDAIGVFDEIDADPVTMYAGKMLALGANPAVATQMFIGQTNLKEGLVRVPAEGKRVATFNGLAAQAFQGIPGAADIQSEIMAASQAIYASFPEARALEPTSVAAGELMEKSVQIALGQVKKKGVPTTGGVQTIMGAPTLLPIGVSGEALNSALRRGLGAPEGANDPRGMLGARNDAVWGEQGPPLHNGKPIPRAWAHNVRIVPDGPEKYRMEIVAGESVFDLADANGNRYSFNVEELLDAAE